MTQHSLQFASTYTPLVMLFHAKFKIGRSTLLAHTQDGLKNINKLYRYTIGKFIYCWPLRKSPRGQKLDSQTLMQ